MESSSVGDFQIVEIAGTIHKVWAGVLGGGSFSSDDNFFLVGGHSMLALRVAGQLAEVFGKQIPLRLLFDHPTIESLSFAIHRHLLTRVAH